VYDVPSEYGFHRLIAPFTTRGAIVARIERDGWICVHGGSVLFAFRSLTPAAWITPDRKEGLDLYATAPDCRRGGWILESVPVTRFPADNPADALEAFARAIATLARAALDLQASPLRLTYTGLSGRELDLIWKPTGASYAGECRVDGRPVDYPSFQLFDVRDAAGRGIAPPAPGLSLNPSMSLPVPNPPGSF
jgi:hypothetical protein